MLLKQREYLKKLDLNNIKQYMQVNHLIKLTFIAKNKLKKMILLKRI